MKSLKCLFFVIIVAAMAAPASATIIDIPDDYDTIQEGIDSSSDGDTVLVQPGEYVERINFNGHNIVLGSLFLITGDTTFITSTIIDGDDWGTVVTFESGEDSTTVITGFTIQNGLAETGGGIFCVSNPRIISCIIKNNQASSLEFGGNSGGGIYCGSSPEIIRCIISQNASGTGGYDNARAGFGGGITIAGSALLDGCIISDNVARTGHDMWGNTYPGFGGGIYLANSDPIFRNCIVFENSARIGAGIYGTPESSSYITNTIIWNNGTSLVSSNHVITYCDIQGGWEGEGNIDCDPMFCDPETDNFYLAENSCCLGAGEHGEDIGALGVGCEPTAVGEDQPLPFEYSLYQNYPNPFNASASINFALPEPGDVRLTVYDIIGRKVETLVQGEQQAGYHQVVWNADDQSSGMYFYRIQAGEFVETKKMLLLK